jgi:hypothetical protein
LLKKQAEEREQEGRDLLAELATAVREQIERASQEGIRGPRQTSGLMAASVSTGNQREYASARDEVAAKMTPQQIAEAQRLAREWKPKPSR